MTGISNLLHYPTAERFLKFSTIAAMLLLSLFLRTRAQAQSALDSFDPNANGNVHVIVVQPDGRILIGGDFTTLSPNGGATIARHGIARLNPDGTVDEAFDPNANQFAGVYAIAVQADGKVLAGGQFTSIGGEARHNIARLDGTTGLADSFDPSASSGPYSSEVHAIAVQPDEKILIGGAFSRLSPNGGGMVTRQCIARMNPDGTLDAAFDPFAADSVYALALQPDGKILVGGYFNSIGGQTRHRVARLDGDTGLADAFNPDAGLAGLVYALAVQADGKILLGGQFSSVGGQPRNSLARLDGTTGLADSFDPSPNFRVYAFAVQADGKILAGGWFDRIGGQQRENIARLDPATGLADSFDPHTDTLQADPVRSIAVQEDGHILIGGSFTRLSPDGGAAVTRNHIARLRVEAEPPTPTPTPTATPTPPATATPAPTAAPTSSPSPSVTPTPTPAVTATPTSSPTSGCDDSWTATSMINSPAYRTFHVAVWTGSEMIVWGGTDGSHVLNTGGKYNPSTDSWTTMSTTNAPPGREYYAAVWTGSEMIVWGGNSWDDPPTGGRYNPSTDSWTAMSMANAPSGRAYYTAVWTGTEMIVWGGTRFSDLYGLNTGGRYNPITDTWAATSTTNAPIGRGHHTAVWTGSEMIAWGGGQAGSNSNTGGRYSPETDSWTATNTTNTPTSRTHHSGVWTGTEMIVWGGSAADNSFNTGGKYNPGTDSWIATNITNVLSVRRHHTAIWTGNEMIIWGGSFYNGSNELSLNTGGRYNPTANSWTAANTVNAPTGRVNHTALWAGSEMIVWGGASSVSNPSQTGGRYCAQQATPAPTATATASATATATAAVAPTLTPSTTPTATLIPTATPTASATATGTVAPTPTPTSTPVGTATPAPSATSTPTPLPVQALNLSTRMRVQIGENVGIGGFIITGSAPKHVVLRAIGPSLAEVGVPDALADPVLELHGPAGFVTVINDNWRDDQEITIAATGLAPLSNLEAAIDATLAPGSYTAIVRGKGNISGVASVEVYDIDQSVPAKLANMSTRALVGTGDDIVIAGFILGGGTPQAGDDRIVVRGIGPSMAALGVANALTDPKLELRDGDGALVASNNDWQDDSAQAAELTAAGLAPTNHLESGLAVTLPPGLYTALLSGANNSAGIGLIEVYDRGTP